MKKESLVNDVFKSLLVAAVVAMGLPDLALAQAVSGGNDLGSAATHISNNDIAVLAPVVSTLFWVVGGVMVGAGALKLKEHAESPAQNPIKHGVARMAVGAALISIPFFSQFITNTLSNTAGTATYTPFQTP